MFNSFVINFIAVLFQLILNSYAFLYFVLEILKSETAYLLLNSINSKMTTFHDQE